MDFIFDPNLVLYLPLYKLDGASILSQDAYGHLCTVTGALWTPQGHSFDGDDYIDFGAASLPTGADDRTVCVWAKTAPVSTIHVFFSYGDLGAQERCNLRISAAGMLMLEINGYATTSIGTWDDDAWHFLRFVQDNGAQRLYIDEVQDGSSTWTLNTVLSLGNIGRSITVGQYWDGLIGEVIVYKRALSQLEIQNIYLATKWRYQ